MHSYYPNNLKIKIIELNYFANEYANPKNIGSNIDLHKEIKKRIFRLLEIISSYKFSSNEFIATISD